MDAETGGVEVGDGSRRTSVDELHGDGMGMGLGLQLVGGDEGGIQEGAGSAGIHECHDRNGEVTRNEKMDGK